jgi:hypothetical protein
MALSGVQRWLQIARQLCLIGERPAVAGSMAPIDRFNSGRVPLISVAILEISPAAAVETTAFATGITV